MADVDNLIEQLSSLDIDDETKQEIAEAFAQHDTNNSGAIDRDELQQALNSANIKVVRVQMHDIYRRYDIDNDGTISLNEFANMVNKEKNAKLAFIGRGKEKTNITAEVDIHRTKHGNIKQVGKGEVRAFSAYLNNIFANDQQIKDLNMLNIDLENPDDLYEKVQNGIFYLKLVNLVEPNTIPEKAINYKKLDRVYERMENLTLAINSAASIGCQCIGTTHITIRDKHENIILGLLWQLIRKNSFKAINLRDNHNLGMLLLPGETLEDLMNLSPEEILLRWVNYHLDKDDNYNGPKLKNFSKDITDSKAYVSLLNRIQPKDLNPQLDYNPMFITNDMDRAKAVHEMASRLDCGDYITPQDIVDGEERVNTLFVSHLFNNHPALEEYEEEEPLDIPDETREEKTFKNWINSI